MRDRLRFFAGTALLLESEELIARLEDMVDEARHRAEAAEAEVQRLRDELARLKPRVVWRAPAHTE